MTISPRPTSVADGVGRRALARLFWRAVSRKTRGPPTRPGGRPTRPFGASIPFPIVTPLTTARRGLSLHVEVDPTPKSGLDEVSDVQCELIRSVSRRRLQHRLGTADAETHLRVSSIIKTLLSH
ncbi:MAG: type II toxin-antitoxin system PemK/MazF family toxin [Actinomycetota bacterium]